MKNPPHPGISVRLNCLDALGLTVSEGARVLGVSRTTLSRLINGRAGLSPEMAVRLAKAFGSTPGAWIRLQAAYDIARADACADEIDVERYAPMPAASGDRSSIDDIVDVYARDVDRTLLRERTEAHAGRAQQQVRGLHAITRRGLRRTYRAGSSKAVGWMAPARPNLCRTRQQGDTVAAPPTRDRCASGFDEEQVAVPEERD